MSVALMREMFEKMVVRKDIGAIDRFYGPSFVMYSNGVTQGRRPSMDHDQPSRREPDPHRGGVDRGL
jgi:hypothetical protein